MKPLERIQRATIKVYTKTGDKGTTALIGGARSPKHRLIFNVLGTHDELSSHIGLACAFLGRHQQLLITQSQLQQIQKSIQTINAKIAGSNKKSLVMPKADVLERWIDEYDEKLPALCNFILPSGGVESAQLHVARAVCRRAERLLFEYVEQTAGEAEAEEAIYMNRLSDYLFTAARYACMVTGNAELVYDYRE